jgi:hypothetical protein
MLTYPMVTTTSVILYVSGVVSVLFRKEFEVVRARRAKWLLVRQKSRLFFSNFVVGHSFQGDDEEHTHFS